MRGISQKIFLKVLLVISFSFGQYFMNTSTAHAIDGFIDFEIGPSGADAYDWYTAQGLTFPTHPIFFETSRARSGNNALLNISAGVEFPDASIVIDFEEDRDVRSVSFFAGLSETVPAGTEITVTAHAYALVDVPSPTPGPPTIPLHVIIDTQTTTVTSGDGPIDTFFELNQSDGEPPIVRVTVSYDLIEFLIIDDLSFEAGTPAPTPEPVPPPRLSFENPVNGDSFEASSSHSEWTRSTDVVFQLAVEADSRVNLIRVTETKPDGSSSIFDLCGGVQTACRSDAPTFDFTQEWAVGYINPGEYQLSAVAYDIHGGVSDPATVGFNVVLYHLQDVELWITGRRELQDEPVVNNFQIIIRVPRGRTLDEVTLEIDDSSVPFGDTKIVLFESPDIVPFRVNFEERRNSRSHYSFYTIRFPFPLWQVGENRIRVLVRTLGGLRGPAFHLSRAAFTYTLPSSTWGIGDEGPGGDLGSSFELPGIPIWSVDCPYVFCKDADQDGFLDLWENIAVEVLRPILFFDVDEKLFDHPDHHVRTFMRVNPINVTGSQVMFRQTIAYSRDYGTDFGPWEVGDHNGDTQSVQTLWNIDGNRIELQWMRGNGHIIPSGIPELYDWIYQAVFTGDGIIKLYVEEDKHGLWPSYGRCDYMSPYDCSNDESLTIRPPSVNVGEPDVERLEREYCPDCPLIGRPFIDNLNHVFEQGPHPAFNNIFPDEAVWSTRYLTFDGGHFCGGLGWDGLCTNQIGRQMHILTGETAYQRWRDDEPALVTPGLY